MIWQKLFTLISCYGVIWMLSSRWDPSEQFAESIVLYAAKYLSVVFRNKVTNSITKRFFFFCSLCFFCADLFIYFFYRVLSLFFFVNHLLWSGMDYWLECNFLRRIRARNRIHDFALVIHFSSDFQSIVMCVKNNHW